MTVLDIVWDQLRVRTLHNFLLFVYKYVNEWAYMPI